MSPSKVISEIVSFFSVDFFIATNQSHPINISFLPLRKSVTMPHTPSKIVVTFWQVSSILEGVRDKFTRRGLLIKGRNWCVKVHDVLPWGRRTRQAIMQCTPTSSPGWTLADPSLYAFAFGILPTWIVLLFLVLPLFQVLPINFPNCFVGTWQLRKFHDFSVLDVDGICHHMWRLWIPRIFDMV